MITIIAKQIIKLEKLEEYHALCWKLVDASRKEPGCISYQSVQAEDDPQIHLFVECWKDQQAVDFHGTTEHFNCIVPQFKAMFDGEEVVMRYQVVF